jgi:hypothetical protein
LKDKIGKRYIKEVLLRFHPELEKRIDFVEVATPLSSEFYLNSHMGSSYGCMAPEAKRFFDPEIIRATRPDTMVLAQNQNLLFQLLGRLNVSF